MSSRPSDRRQRPIINYQNPFEEYYPLLIASHPVLCRRVNSDRVPKQEHSFLLLYGLAAAAFLLTERGPHRHSVVTNLLADQLSTGTSLQAHARQCLGVMASHRRRHQPHSITASG